MGKIGDLFVKLGWKSGEFDKGIAASKRKTKDFTDTATAALGKVAARFVSVAAAAKMLGDGIKTMMQFERANSTLASVLGKTTAGIKDLTSAAVDLGKKTMYTASQVTELQTSLARLGFDQGQILDMQEGVLKFAAAVGTDLASAADFTGAALRAFGLESKDTTALLDVMAASTSKSALDFSKLQTSIAIVAPVANAFGLSAADTVAILGGLSNAGFDASSAATAFRNILLNLADANGNLAKGLGHTAKTFPEIIAALQECESKGIDLNTVLGMTDKRSVAAFSSLIKGADSVRELRDALDGADGSLESMYGTMTDNLSGAVDELKSAWEGLVLTFREANGPLASIARNFADILNFVSDLRSGKSVAEALDAKSNTQLDRGINETIRVNAEAGTNSKEGYEAAIAERIARISQINDQISAPGAKSTAQLLAFDKELKRLEWERDVLDGAYKRLYGNETTTNAADNPVLTGADTKGGNALPGGYTEEEWEDYQKQIKKAAEELASEAAALEQENEEVEELNNKVLELYRMQNGLEPLQPIDQDVLHTADKELEKYDKWLKEIAKDTTEINRAFETLEDLELGSIQYDLDEGLDAIDKSLNKSLGNISTMSLDLGNLVSGALTTAINDFSDTMQTLFDTLLSGEDLDASTLTSALLTPLCDMAKQMGTVVMAMGAAALELESSIAVNPAAVIAAGAALVAIGAAGKAALSAIASGSSATSTTTTGTSTAAATTSSAELTVYVKGTIKGSDILISGQNTMTEWSK